MSEFVHEDTYFAIKIDYDKYYQEKVRLIKKELDKSTQEFRLTMIESFCLKELEIYKRYYHEGMKGRETCKTNNPDEELPPYYIPVEIKQILHQIRKVISWLKQKRNETEEILIMNEDSHSNKIKKGYLGSAQNLTIAFMYILFNHINSEESFDTSKLRDFINLFIKASSDNVKKHIDNAKRIVFRHLQGSNSVKKANRNDKIAFLKVLVNVRNIFIMLSLEDLIIEVSKNIDTLNKEIER